MDSASLKKRRVRRVNLSRPPAVVSLVPRTSELKPGACPCLERCRRALQRQRPTLPEPRSPRLAEGVAVGGAPHKPATLPAAARRRRSQPQAPGPARSSPHRSRVRSARSTRTRRSRCRARGRSLAPPLLCSLSLSLSLFYLPPLAAWEGAESP